MAKGEDLRAASRRAMLAEGGAVEPEPARVPDLEAKPDASGRSGPRAGRPLAIYVTDAERAVIEAAAERASLSVSAWVRATALRVARGG